MKLLILTFFILYMFHQCNTAMEIEDEMHTIDMSNFNAMETALNRRKRTVQAGLSIMAKDKTMIMWQEDHTHPLGSNFHAPHVTCVHEYYSTSGEPTNTKCGNIHLSTYVTHRPTGKTEDKLYFTHCYGYCDKATGIFSLDANKKHWGSIRKGNPEVEGWTPKKLDTEDGEVTTRFKAFWFNECKKVLEADTFEKYISNEVCKWVTSTGGSRRNRLLSNAESENKKFDTTKGTKQ